MALAKSLYAIPTWTHTCALVAEHSTIAPDGDVPSVYACYRFIAKLRAHAEALTRCIDSVTAGLRERIPELGRNVATDASDTPAYANGQRYLSKNGPERESYSDPDATWGTAPLSRRGRAAAFYGYRLHTAVCTQTDLPLAWTVDSASANESMFVAPLLDTVQARRFSPHTPARWTRATT